MNYSKSVDYEELAKMGVYAYTLSWKVLIPREDEDGTVFQAIRSGQCEVGSEDDAYAVGRFLIEWCEKLFMEYEITVHDRFMRKWIHAWDSSKMRVANPKHRVFVVIGGTDCDGMSWARYYSYATLEEAAKDVEDSLAWADGPTNYSTLSVEDWEMGGYPEYRDRYAEIAGY